MLLLLFLSVYAAYNMSTHLTLRLIHYLYLVSVSIAAWIQRRKRRQPHPLNLQRSKVPKHLCLNLVASDNTSTEETETAFLQCLQSVAEWCRVSGIETLTAYDRDGTWASFHIRNLSEFGCIIGVLVGCPESVRRRVFAADKSSEDSCESEVEYPLTPPLSEPSGSRSQSPYRGKLLAELSVVTIKPPTCVRKRRNVAVRRRPKSECCPSKLARVFNRSSGKGAGSISSNLTLHLISRDSAKPAVASASRSLLDSYVNGVAMSGVAQPSGCDYNLSIAELDSMLEGELGFSVQYPHVLNSRKLACLRLTS
jgi:dehydrodolichyl diphosphate syntase complex subunit NUS1